MDCSAPGSTQAKCGWEHWPGAWERAAQIQIGADPDRRCPIQIGARSRSAEIHPPRSRSVPIQIAAPSIQISAVDPDRPPPIQIRTAEAQTYEN